MNKCKYCNTTIKTTKFYCRHHRLIIDAWKKTRNRANIKKLLPTAISFDYIVSLYPTDMRCPVFGIEMIHGNENGTSNSPSVDRIDPTKGYVEGNLQIISNKANLMKQNACKEQLIQFAKWILK